MNITQWPLRIVMIPSVTSRTKYRIPPITNSTRFLSSMAGQALIAAELQPGEELGRRPLQHDLGGRFPKPSLA